MNDENREIKDNRDRGRVFYPPYLYVVKMEIKEKCLPKTICSFF